MSRPPFYANHASPKRFSGKLTRAAQRAALEGTVYYKRVEAVLDIGHAVAANAIKKIHKEYK